MKRRNLMVGALGLLAGLFVGTDGARAKPKEPEAVCAQRGHETQAVCEPEGSVSFCDRRLLECVRCHVLLLEPDA